MSCKEHIYSLEYVLSDSGLAFHWNLILCILISKQVFFVQYKAKWRKIYFGQIKTEHWKKKKYNQYKFAFQKASQKM